MHKKLSLIVLAAFLAACTPTESKESTYKVGQTVVHNLSGYKGSVMSIWNSCYKVGGDCRYYVRFHTPNKVDAFFTMEAREFELKSLDSLR